MELALSTAAASAAFDPAIEDKTVVVILDENQQVLDIVDAEKVVESLKSGNLSVNTGRIGQRLGRLSGLSGIAAVLMVDDGRSLHETALAAMEEIAKSFKPDFDMRKLIFEDTPKLAAKEQEAFFFEQRCTCGNTVKNRGSLCQRCQRQRQKAHHFRKR